MIFWGDRYPSIVMNTNFCVPDDRMWVVLSYKRPLASEPLGLVSNHCIAGVRNGEEQVLRRYSRYFMGLLGNLSAALSG